MKGKITIRYLRFRPSGDGGRIFDFSISESERPDRPIGVEIPVVFFQGHNRILLQEGVSISYAAIKRFFELADSTNVTRMISLDANELALHRPPPPTNAKRGPQPVTAKPAAPAIITKHGPAPPFRIRE